MLSLIALAAALAAAPTLTVTTSGGGTVTGPGISCGADCSEPYPVKTVRTCQPSPELLPGQCEWVTEQQPQRVTLTPSAPAGWTFTGWTGACSGTDACTVEMDADASVSAAWAPPPTTSPPASGAPGDAPPAGGTTVSGPAPAATHGSATVQSTAAPGSLRFTLDYRYERDGRAAWFTALTLSQLSHGTAVRVSCTGAGCPRKATLHAVLHRRLRPGARLTVRMTRTGLKGRLVRLTIGRDRRPTVLRRCLGADDRTLVACG